MILVLSKFKAAGPQPTPTAYPQLRAFDPLLISGAAYFTIHDIFLIRDFENLCCHVMLLYYQNEQIACLNTQFNTLLRCRIHLIQVYTYIVTWTSSNFCSCDVIARSPQV